MNAPSSLPVSGRPYPASSVDTRFFWEGTRVGELRIQRCTACLLLRHPPGPACPRCHSFDWDYLVSTGRGSLYSFVVQRHPLPPGFDGPVAIGLVELAEGVRVIANIDADPDTLTIGTALDARFIDQAEGWTALAFTPVPLPK